MKILFLVELKISVFGQYIDVFHMVCYPISRNQMKDKKADFMDINKELFFMQQAYATLFSLTNKVQMAGDQYLKELTSRQYMAMLAAAHLAEDERTINNIARKLGTTKQSVKQLITKLEEKRFITAEPSKKDKRAVNIKFTEAGVEVMLKCGELGIYLLADFFKDFSSSEIETLWILLKKLYRFDGEEQDGFEAEGAVETNQDLTEIQERVLTEFKKRRNAK
jgi:DNA-binding MarR family transcriptional regulator